MLCRPAGVTAVLPRERGARCVLAPHRAAAGVSVLGRRRCQLGTLAHTCAWLEWQAAAWPWSMPLTCAACRMQAWLTCVYRTAIVSVDCTVSVVGAALVYACRTVYILTAPGRVDDAWTPLQYARRMQWHTGQMTERGGAGQVDAET